MSDNRVFLPYGRQWIDESDIAAVTAALNSDFLTQGPEIERFEAEILKVTGARYCVALSNATAALHIAVAALELDVGMEGITSPNTFVASANCMPYSRIVPRFADIDDRSYCIDPEQISRKIGPKTKVLIPVDFAGQSADMPAIKKIADEKGLRVIEDASHAIGSLYPDGKPVGCCDYSDMTVFSFHPVKTITTGEGGAITTNDEKLYRKLSLLRTHGILKDPARLTQNPGPWYYEMVDLGYNYRMTDLQAALGVSQLGRLELFKKRRKEIIAAYNEAFRTQALIRIPYQAPGANSCFHLYVLRIDFAKLGKDRKTVMAELRENGVGSQVHYIPVHTQPYYQKTFGYKQGDFPVAERYYEEALSLPLFPKMGDGDVQHVIDSVQRVFA
jgi:UDP-4-amino-4,6-dideoxy-N-acetyl-beta-L-altrosamine transaminase